MKRIHIAAVVVAGLLVATLTTSSTARPPTPPTAENGLTENESATLWSRDDDTGYISNEAYRDAYGESRSAVAQVANATDLTFREPPATAATWTRNDHAAFEGGGRDTSAYPPDANLTGGEYIAAAHATVFAVAPSTVTHRTPNETHRYVAPNGTLRGIVDYRVDVPADERSDSRTVEYELATSSVEEARLYDDGDDRLLATVNGSKTPALQYRLPSTVETLRLEADINASVNVTATTREEVTVEGPNGTTETRTRVRTRTETRSETITATDRYAVTPYDPSVLVTTARYPDGDRGVAAFYTQPWQGLVLTRNGSQRVRGVWRFYTARNPRWDRLTYASENTTEQRPSPVLPVAVHAYPSRLGPRTDPVARSPTLLRVWGSPYETPAPALPETVHVDVVTQAYTASDGLAVRTDAGRHQGLTVRGIVRGVNASIQRTGPPQDIRPTTLDVRVLSRTPEQIRLQVTLQNAATGEPIGLRSRPGSRYDSVTGGRAGYIELGPQRVQTNRSGEATVTLTEPGVYTARYVPGSWVEHDPAYTRAKATVRWHPLTTVDGWFALLVRGLQWFLPFALALYAGRKLGQVFSRWGGSL